MHCGETNKNNVSVNGVVAFYRTSCRYQDTKMSLYQGIKVHLCCYLFLHPVVSACTRLALGKCKQELAETKKDADSAAAARSARLV